MPKVLLLAWDRIFKIRDALGNKPYKPEDIQDLLRELFNDVQNIHEELVEYINTPRWNRPAFYNNGNDDDEDCTIAVTPDFSITDSLIMENEHLDTISEMKSDEFIKSSVENLVPIPSESEDFSDIESECDMLDCDNSQMTNFSTFSNPLFDDSTSSDDESSHEEVIHEISFKTYSNPLFDLDKEIISSESNPIYNEDLNSTPKNDCFDTKSYLFESLLNRDESIPLGIDIDDSDSEGDTLFVERLLHDDPIPLPDTLDFSYDIRVFLPLFTYPMTSLILLSSGSEDTIFDPGIYHFSSLEPGVKENQEKDKIGSKPDKNGKRGKAGKSQKQLQLKEEENRRKQKKNGRKRTHGLKVIKLLIKEEMKGANIAIPLKFKSRGQSCQVLDTCGAKDERCNE
uniref:Uncharacterized protein n=1 Tax=Tanacetum cinerariifolium TaxID=118510 RepID=A0A6L2JMZ1_TANCI|nr:hypothetical protein [Tanacetum cinerariifolium]